MRMPFEKGFMVSSPYGPRIDPLTNEESSWHGGIDLVGADTLVRAVVSGTVIRSRIVMDPDDRTSEWGNYVSVYGADGHLWYYCHLASRAVEEGARVEEGEILGIEGMTGRATGAHLHLECRTADNRTTLNPTVFLGIPNVAGFAWKPLEPWETQAHDWSREAVGWAVGEGIIKGRGGDDYALGEPVTREELCVILWRARKE